MKVQIFKDEMHPYVRVYRDSTGPDDIVRDIHEDLVVALEEVRRREQDILLGIRTHLRETGQEPIA